MSLSSRLDRVFSRLGSQSAIKLDLERIEHLLAKLGNPHNQLPPVVHVAGTNGKGSTLAFLRAMLEASGYKVHVYTSPHLIHFNERFRLAGELVDDDTLAETLEEIERVNDGDDITFFEITTAAAFLLFARVPADIVLLETGLGGRLDATNVIRRPAATAITRISIDHTEFLGDTIEKIAAEKAGILKPGAPCIIAPQHDEAVLRVLQARADEIGAPLVMHGKDWELKFPNHSDSFSLHTGNSTIAYPLPNLIGQHQVINAGTALMILNQLKDFPVPQSARNKGLQNTEWPGRLERITSIALPENTELWFDGAHNDSGAEALARQLQLWAGENNKPVILTVGMLTTKDPSHFLKTLMAFCDGIYFTRGNNEKFFAPGDLMEIAKNCMTANKIKKTTMLNEDSLKQIAMSHPGNRLVVCGSLYLREIL